MWWLPAIQTLILTAGLAKLTTIAINRILSSPKPNWVASGLKLLQLAMITSYTMYLGIRAKSFVYTGDRPDPAEVGALFNAFTSNPIHRFDAILVMAGLIGFLFLIRAAISYQLYMPPKCQIKNDSRIIDFRRSRDLQPWKQILVGQQPMRTIALLPWNQQFQVEVSTKTYVLPRLDPAWDGLSMVHLTDTHFRGAVSQQYFEAVCEQAADLKPDLFLFTGDLLDDPSLLDWLPETLGRLSAPLGRYFILGNHDWYLDSSEIRQGFEQLGWTDLAGRSQEIRCNNPGPPLIVAGDETPWMGNHPALTSDSQDRFCILLSHTPDNITWAREQGIDLMLAGHTHGGQIRLPFLGPVYSPSRFGCRFASGVFWLEPTLLYVSRGLSGREPIRYLCLPELTKIVLRSTHSAG